MSNEEEVWIYRWAERISSLLIVQNF